MPGGGEGVEGQQSAPRISISRTSTESDPGSRRLPAHNPAAQHPGSEQQQERPRVNTRRASDYAATQRQRTGTFQTSYSHDSRAPDYAKKTWSWKHKHHQDGDLKWRIKWTEDCFASGRVLVIDYISSERAEEISPNANGKRQILIAAQEFDRLEGLENFYKEPTRCNQAALRVIHVQNAPWATGFLLKKFNIDNRSDLVGMEDFARWARYESPRLRNGKPFPNGRSWRAQVDPWRSISRSAFGLDYLKTYRSVSPQQGVNRSSRPLDAQVLHLNAYEDGSSPNGYDVSVQRLSVYLQKNLGPSADLSPEEDVKNPYHKHDQYTNGKTKEPIGNVDGNAHSKEDIAKPECHEDHCARVEDFDNCSTVILFEQSASLQLDDCLIQPRRDLENRWRRLTFYLRKEDVLDDHHIASHCTNLILSDIFLALGTAWQVLLSAASDHVSILEDKIYENPADESRAPELWINQSAWLKVEKVVWIHQDVIHEMQIHLREMGDADPNNVGEDWLSSALPEYEKLQHAVQEDLVTPTNNLSDLMYKSVGIRDSRQSLQLGLSMWRLSWITFIFLPLTFIVSFFGMNVDAFEYFPSIGWYFLAAALTLISVLFLWYCIKHSVERRRQTAYQRGTYEHLFHELGEQYPALWNDHGANPDIQPTGWQTRLKWHLLRRWFAPDRTVDRRIASSIEDDAGLGAWARMKWFLLKRWLPEVNRYRRISSNAGDDEEAAGGSGSTAGLAADTRARTRRGRNGSIHDPPGTINELAKLSTPVFIADSEPHAVQPIATYAGLRPLNLSRISAGDSRGGRRTSSVESGGRPGSRGSSGMLFEERNLSDSETDVDVEGDAGEGAFRAEERRVSLSEAVAAIRRSA